MQLTTPTNATIECFEDPCYGKLGIVVSNPNVIMVLGYSRSLCVQI